MPELHASGSGCSGPAASQPTLQGIYEVSRGGEDLTREEILSRVSSAAPQAASAEATGSGDHVLAARPGEGGHPFWSRRASQRDRGKARERGPAEPGSVAHPEGPSNKRPGEGGGQEESCSFPIFLICQWP